MIIILNATRPYLVMSCLFNQLIDRPRQKLFYIKRKKVAASSKNSDLAYKRRPNTEMCKN